MSDVGYSHLYKLQLIFAEMDASSDIESVVSKHFEDQPSKDAIMWLYDHKRSGSSSESEVVDLENLDLQAETASLYSDTKALKFDGATLDAREALAVNKLQMELLGKILDLHERSKRYRQIGEFIQSVFDILTEEQKDKLLKDFDGVYHE